MIYVLAGIILVVLILCILIGIGIMRPVFRSGVPFVPTNQSVIQTMIKYTQPKKGEQVYDLGSGNGSILFRFPKHCHRHGYELDGILIVWARIRNWLRNDQVIFHQQDFFQIDLASADIITGYLFPHIMIRFETELWAKLPKGCRMALNGFPMPNITPKHQQKVGKHTVYYYVKT